MTTLLPTDLSLPEKVAFLASFKAKREGTPVLSDDEQIKTMVARRLGGHPRLVPAQFRAVNNFNTGLISKEESIRRACAWANCAITDDDEAS